MVPTMFTTETRRRHIVAAVAIAYLLGGCSGERAADSGRPQVASLSSAGPVASASIDLDDQRPLATSDDEISAMYEVWENCVRKEGGPKYQETPKLVFDEERETDPAKRAVWDACYPKLPERFDERLKRTDLTAYKDNQREFYVCAKAAGYKLTAPDPEDGSFGLTEIGPNGDAQSVKWLECERKAFAG
jgi:hypothetical protein